MESNAPKPNKQSFSSVSSVSSSALSVTESFGLSRTWTLAIVGACVLAAGAAVVMSVFFAPSLKLTATSGPVGSSAESQAVKYQVSLKKNYQVTLNLVNSQGSLDNLARLTDPKQDVDIGFVQSEVFETNPSANVSPEIKKANEAEAAERKERNGKNNETLTSIGSIAYQPLFIFYRNPTPVTLLSEFAGKKLSIGTKGSGTRRVALTLLKANGILEGAGTVMDSQDSDAASDALLAGSVDAVFLMGDSASSAKLRKLLTSPGIQLLSMTQANALVRKFSGLKKVVLPQGGIDFGKNIPAQDVVLVGPTVELIARKDINPALIDFILETAKEVSGRGTLIQNPGEFPAPIEQNFTIHDEAIRYYKNGMDWKIRKLPFWLATFLTTLMDNIVVVVPIVVTVVGIVQGTIKGYKFQIQFRLNRRYRALVKIEKEYFQSPTAADREELIRQLRLVEDDVKKLKVPGSLASQFYGLRQHIEYVGGLLAGQGRP